MLIFSEDQNYVVDVGSNDIIPSLYSTMKIRLDDNKETISLALFFLEKYNCAAANTLKTAKQFTFIKQKLSKFPVDKIVYDYTQLEKPHPWLKSLDASVKTCADFYLTADGKNLIDEIISVLEYGDNHLQAVIILPE